MFKWLALVILSAVMGVAQAAQNDFTLSGTDGVSHSLKDFRGKWVVVNFWATWCPPCLEELPGLVAFHDQHKDHDAVVIGINYEDIGADQLAAFIKSHHIGYTVLRLNPADTSPFGDISGLPTTYVVNPQGETVARQVGPITGAALESFIRRKTAAQVKPTSTSVPPKAPVASPAR